MSPDANVNRTALGSSGTPRCQIYARGGRMAKEGWEDIWSRLKICLPPLLSLHVCSGGLHTVSSLPKVQ